MFRTRSTTPRVRSTVWLRSSWTDCATLFVNGWARDSLPGRRLLRGANLPDGRPVECELLAPHQKTAVGRILGMLSHRAGAILADDVGLGKSFVAAAVMAAMQREGCQIELIVPAMLRAQWIETIDRFGVVATLTT